MADKVVQSEILGEPGTGYEDPEGKGPFECGNCEYYRESDSSCGQKTMKKDSSRERTKEGRVKVEAKGCCEYVDRIGEEKKEKEEQGSRERGSRTSFYEAAARHRAR